MTCIVHNFLYACQQFRPSEHNSQLWSRSKWWLVFPSTVCIFSCILVILTVWRFLRRSLHPTASLAVGNLCFPRLKGFSSDASQPTWHQTHVLRRGENLLWHRPKPHPYSYWWKNAYNVSYTSKDELFRAADEVKCANRTIIRASCKLCVHGRETRIQFSKYMKYPFEPIHNVITLDRYRSVLRSTNELNQLNI